MPVRIVRYTPNRLLMEVQNTAAKPAWLFYSDTWHPRWKARVNGKPGKVYRANLAYKAVRIPPGPSKVEFFFQDRLVLGLHYVFAALSLAALGAIGVILHTSFADLAGSLNRNRNDNP